MRFLENNQQRGGVMCYPNVEYFPMKNSTNL